MHIVFDMVSSAQACSNSTGQMAHLLKHVLLTCALHHDWLRAFASKRQVRCIDKALKAKSDDNYCKNPTWIDNPGIKASFVFVSVSRTVNWLQTETVIYLT